MVNLLKTPVSGKRHLNELGARIRRIRLSKGWRMRDLANESGVSYPQVNRLERAEAYPYRSTVEKIAKALRCRYKDLLSGGKGL